MWANNLNYGNQAGGMHSRGHAWQGTCVAGEAWQGACMAGGMCGKGVYMAGACMCGMGCVWQGACVARGCVWQEGMHVWQERQPLQWVVHILLQCILVLYFLPFFINHTVSFTLFYNSNSKFFQPHFTWHISS